MQLYAYDSHHCLILADQAEKQCNYTCMECGSAVRLRRGLYRKPHFYHTQPNRACHLNAKGLKHLMVQYHLKNCLPVGEAELECRFPQVQRIADVAWHPNKLIYEIQYSPISKEEVNARNKDYASLGYQVIWIFHDDTYNQERMTMVENFMCAYPHYFTNIDEKGVGMLYDQMALVKNGRRVLRSPILDIDPAAPKKVEFIEKAVLRLLPTSVKERLTAWPLVLSGDLADAYLLFCRAPDTSRLTSPVFDEIKRVFKETHDEKLWIIESVRKFFKKAQLAYSSLIHLVLERACR